MTKYGVFQSRDSKRWFVKSKGIFGNIVPEASNLGKPSKEVFGLLSSSNIKGFKTRKKAIGSMKKYIRKKK